MLYINTRFKEDRITELKGEYDSNMLYAIRQYTSLSASGKQEKDLKMWSEILGKINGTVKEDNRTSEQIINDTLAKFKK